MSLWQQRRHKPTAANLDECEPGSASSSVGPAWVAAVALLLIYGVCLVNTGIAIDFTRRLDGPRPDSLQRRYGDIRDRLDGVPRIAYISDSPAYFLGARYALVPTILDISYVELQREGRSVSRYLLDAMVDDALVESPLRVLCEFDNPEGFETFIESLSFTAAQRGLGVEVQHQAGPLSLLSLGG